MGRYGNISVSKVAKDFNAVKKILNVEHTQQFPKQRVHGRVLCKRPSLWFCFIFGQKIIFGKTLNFRQDFKHCACAQNQRSKAKFGWKNPTLDRWPETRQVFHSAGQLSSNLLSGDCVCFCLCRSHVIKYIFTGFVDQSCFGRHSGVPNFVE